MGRTGPGPIVARPIKNTNVRPVAWPRAKTSEFPRPGLPLAGPTQARSRPARAWPGLTLARGNTRIMVPGAIVEVENLASKQGICKFDIAIFKCWSLCMCCVDGLGLHAGLLLIM